MIVVVSRISVTSGNSDALAEQYRNRRRLAETMPGCLGVEILRHQDRPDEFVVYTRWENQDAFDRYQRHPAFRNAHARISEIPGRLRIDPDTRSTDRYEVLS